jgi:hypothetical protein
MGATRHEALNRAVVVQPRSIASAIAQRAASNTPQLSSLQVSSPTDAAEVEAERVAHRIVSMPAPAAPAAPTQGLRSPLVSRLAASVLQRRETQTTTVVPPALAAEMSGAAGGGAPLPNGVKGFMESRFGARFDNVRVHTDARAQKMNNDVNAKAFTVGSQIFFSGGAFQPDSKDGRQLLAHELTHTIQQGAVAQAPKVQRSALPIVSERAQPQVQRGIGAAIKAKALKWVSEQLEGLPGYSTFKMAIGYDPVNNKPVERDAGAILDYVIGIFPFGDKLRSALGNHGILGKIGTWVKAQVQAGLNIGATIAANIKNFMSGVDITEPRKSFELGKAIIMEPIAQAKSFALGLWDGAVQFVKDAILKPIAAYARGTSGYPLLCDIMGKDPITGDGVTADPERLILNFLNFVNEGETAANMKKTKAVPRAIAWFKNGWSTLKGFVNEIPGLFMSTLKSLTITDILTIAGAFVKFAKVFGGFAARFIAWGASAVWDLLEIIFEAAKPGVMGTVKRAAGALRDILRNPLPFIGNLVAAGKLGFSQFATNFLTHLKNGLLDWLTGSLDGVYIPKSLEIKELVKLALSVLGLTWANLRAKLVKSVGEPAVKVMEGGFELVKTLVTQGPTAAWEQLKTQLASLRDTIISGITSMVVEAVVQKAVPKVIAMFIPGAGFVGAIMAIYDTAVVVMQKIQKIAAVVGAFVNSIVQIAQGNVSPAANRMEGALAGILSVAIAFLAQFAGLGKVAAKIREVIAKVRAPVDKALDWLINLVVSTAKKLFQKAFNLGKDGKPVPGAERTPQQKQADLHKGVAEGNALLAVKEPDLDAVRKKLPAILARYKLKALNLVTDSTNEEEEVVHIHGEVNPLEDAPKVKVPKGGPDSKVTDKYLVLERPSFSSRTKRELRKAFIKEGGSAGIFKGERGSFKSSTKWHRRHLVSWGDMRAHYLLAFLNKLVKQCASLLPGAPMTLSSCVAAIKKKARAAFNDVPNLFIGLGAENSSLQEALDVKHPKLAEVAFSKRVAKCTELVQKFIDRHGIAGVGLTLSPSADIALDWEVEYVQDPNAANAA